MTKLRIKIPADIAAEVMFNSDSTCCFCRERGKAVQIHHIDENPRNNSIDNLSVLCLHCHNDAQVKGGFGRKRNASLVIKYRDEWISRVALRRDLADKRAVNRHVGSSSISEVIEVGPEPTTHHEELREPPINYINALPEFKAALLKQAQPKWDTGVTATMIQANYDYIDSLTGILVTLAKYISPKQFEGKDPHEYFSEAISFRFMWHRTINEPFGPGTGGTIVNVLVGGGVIGDVEKMVEDLVMGLVGYDDSFDWKNWPKRWQGKET
ncbi:MAG: HNH endonuclease signature motif containing protein [Candidatus Neomarinimicrobiota bacterium]